MCSAALAQQAAVLCCAVAAVVHRCFAGTASKIQPSLSAIKLTAWARLVAPSTRAGRWTSSCSCTRWSAPLCCAAETEARLVTLERDAIRPATGRVHAHVSRGCTQHGAGVSRRRARVIPAFPRSARLTSAPRTVYCHIRTERVRERSHVPLMRLPGCHLTSTGVQ